MSNIYPRWTNHLPLKIIVAVGLIGGAVALGLNTYFTPKYTRVGYQPNQPIPFSHPIHVGQLGMDCRYCHSFAEKSGHANVPSSQSCWNCHQQIKTNSEKLEPLRRSIDPSYDKYDGKPIQWVKVHSAPDYAYFDHSVHLNSGVSCFSCHGDVSEMNVVYHHESQSMSWCLDCHRAPQNHLRPLDKITDLKWKPEQDHKKQAEMGMKIRENLHITPPENCAGCHR